MSKLSPLYLICATLLLCVCAYSYSQTPTEKRSFRLDDVGHVFHNIAPKDQGFIGSCDQAAATLLIDAAVYRQSGQHLSPKGMSWLWLGAKTSEVIKKDTLVASSVEQSLWFSPAAGFCSTETVQSALRKLPPPKCYEAALYLQMVAGLTEKELPTEHMKRPKRCVELYEAAKSEGKHFDLELLGAASTRAMLSLWFNAPADVATLVNYLTPFCSREALVRPTITRTLAPHYPDRKQGVAAITKAIDDALDAGLPAAVKLCAHVFNDPQVEGVNSAGILGPECKAWMTTKYGGEWAHGLHTTTVIGRECRGNSCDYIVRDSNPCSENSKRCKNSHHTVAADALARNTSTVAVAR